MQKKYILNGEELGTMDTERASIVAEQAILEGHKVVVTDEAVEVTVTKLETSTIERDEPVVEKEEIIATGIGIEESEEEEALPVDDEEDIENE